MGREFELKYRLSDEAFTSLRERFAPFTPITMETTYFDTSDGLLRPLRWTLRRRLENGVAVCTVKIPGEGGGCGEWETECDDILAALPLLVALGAPALLLDLAQKGLVPTCAARFTRMAAKIQADQCTVELALDRGCLLGGGKELPLSEVEVELKAGSEAAAARFSQALAAQYHLTAEPKSKLQRALELANT